MSRWLLRFVELFSDFGRDRYQAGLADAHQRPDRGAGMSLRRPAFCGAYFKTRHAVMRVSTGGFLMNMPQLGSNIIAQNQSDINILKAEL